MVADTYYHREDDMNTPEVELDNLQAQEHALSTVVTDTADRLNRVVDIAAWLNGRQQDTDDRAFLGEIVAISNVMGTQLAQAAIAHKAAGAFARKMFEYHQKLARDYNDISDKLEDVEEDLDDLRDAFEETMAEAYANIFDELHESIRNLTGCDRWDIIYRVIDLLLGNIVATDVQRGLLSRILETLDNHPEQAS